MSKLLTQKELSYAVGNITMATDNDGALTSLIDLAHHIDALTEQRDDDVKHLMAIFQECKRRAEKAEAELKRRDELAAQEVAQVVSRCGNDLRIGWLRPELCDVGTKLYAAPPAPATGINAIHSDPNLSPGEYSVNISTKGGAAIINGVPPAYNRCQYCISNDMPKCVHGSHWGNEAPAVPDELPDSDDIGEYEDGYNNGWNACRAAMLANKERE